MRRTLRMNSNHARLLLFFSAFLSVLAVGISTAFHVPLNAASISNFEAHYYPNHPMAATDGHPPDQDIDANALQAAQAHPEFGRIAAQTAKKVAKIELHRILTTPLLGCLGAPQVCGELDAALHAAIKQSVPGAQFIQREEAMKYLAPHGFLSLDAYVGALNDVAADAGAEAVVGEDFERSRGGCHLRTTLVDAKRLYALAEFSTGIPCSADPGITRLSLLKDSATGVAMIVAMPQSADSPREANPIHYPTCLSCPDPHYSQFAKSKHVEGQVHLMITVTNQGTVENAKVIDAVEEGLQRVSLEAVNQWKLSPARDSDGTTFPCRVKVEVTFRLVN